jgi:hypothetical protein
MTDAATPSPEAALAACTADPSWAGKLLSGDAATRAEFDQLTRQIAGVSSDAPGGAARDLAPFDPLAANARERLPLIESVTDGQITMSEQIRVVESMRQNGMNDVIIREALDDNRAYPAELHELAREKWRDLATDADFVRRLFAGDAAAARQWRGYCVIAAGGVEG